MSNPNYVNWPGGFGLNWARLLTQVPDNINQCYLVALDNRQLNLIQSVIAQLQWYWLWDAGKTDSQEIRNYLYELDYCLMSGCSVEDLITAIDNVRTELSSIDVTLGAGNAQSNTNLIAIDTTLGAGNAQETADLNAINTTLAGIDTALDTIKASIDSLGGGEDLEDDLANVWGQLVGILRVLGGITATGSPL